jgi:hypothetical protein
MTAKSYGNAQMKQKGSSGILDSLYGTELEKAT